MKKFKILTLIIITILSFSCSSSDDNETASNQLLTEIVGKWKNYQRIQNGQVIDVEECNGEYFIFYEDLSGSYDVVAGSTLNNGECTGGSSGGFGFNYEALSNGTLNIYISVIDAYIVNKDGNDIYLNPIDEDSGEIDANTKLLLRKVTN
ncbi:hypothetical protein VOI54_03865 [Tamlana sp. 2201CG12-4]|uniref:hypothetical protein n=1 Tax=Tamlana sp. 2201CG12-4 TaxID=3112582 RepID=UPI002DB572E1|nr:hypothetical protein [Tamlana sp. 2201CG12-4]MEC3906140.1 hypothetical protein [Tamlana sp. 2201CG12-4]